MRVCAQTEAGSFELRLDPESSELKVNDLPINLDGETDIRRLVQDHSYLRPVRSVTLGLKIPDPLRALLVGLALGGVRVVEEAMDRAHDESWAHRSSLLERLQGINTNSDLLLVILGLACGSRNLTVTDPHGRPVALRPPSPRRRPPSEPPSAA